jgi:glutaredoxin
MPEYELFGAKSCPHTQDMREWLDWKGYEYVEYDVEADHEARAHMIAISGGQRTVPVLVQDGVVIQIGWQGRGCVVEGPRGLHA